MMSNMTRNTANNMINHIISFIMSNMISHMIINIKDIYLMSPVILENKIKIILMKGLLQMVLLSEVEIG